MNLKETLIGQLRDEFDDEIYRRGKNYYTDGAVLKMESEESDGDEDITIHGRVDGSQVYNTWLFFNLRNMEFEGFDCSCPYDDDHCKHGAALGLKFIDAISDFSENGKNTEFDKNELEEYIDRGRDLSAVRSPKKATGDQLDKLKKLFSLNENRLSQDMLEEAKKILGINSGQTTLRRDVNPNIILPEIRETKSDEININNFYLAVYFGYGEISVNIYKNGFDRQALEAGYFLKRKNALTKNQIEFMEFLAAKKTWQDKLDPVILILLVEKSGMRYYKMNYGTKTSLRIIDNQQLNFSAKLMDKSFFNEHLKKEIIKIMFEMGVKDIKNLKMFFGEKGVVLEEGARASICHLPEFAVVFLKKIKERLSYYRYDKEKTAEVQLDEEEIININGVIGDLKTGFDLTTDLPDKIDVEEHKKSEPKILVDYDALAQTLEIKVVIDYGIEKQNVGESVYPARIKDKIELRRRDLFSDKKYIIRKNDYVINWNKIQPKKEIKLFRTFYNNPDETSFSKSLILRRKGDNDIFDFYEKKWPRITRICQKENIAIEYVKDKLEVESVKFKADFKVDLDAENDWLAFDIDCYCGEGKITLELLKEYVLEKKGIIKKDGKLIRIENKEELEKLILMLESFYQKGDKKFEGRIYHAPELESVLSGSEYYNSKVSTGFKKFIQEAQSGKPVKKVKIPSPIKNTLRDYQRDGLDWFYFLRKYHFGGILADDMGLGKTLQALSLVAMNKVEGKPSLVICPKTLLFNWEDEAAKFFPAMKTLVVEGGPKERAEKLKQIKKHDLVVASYPSVKKDEERYLKLEFNYCILDEAQFIKNHQTQSAKAVKKINANYRLALTGTPLENSVSEVWSIFDYLMPGFLGNKRSFFERFEKPIMKNSDGAALETLKKKTACFMLRRTKEKVLKELPSKIEQPSYCQLSDHQNILYQEILANVKSEIFEVVKTKGFSKSQIHILAGLTKLRQVCNHPVLLLKDKNHEKFESAKLELFLELVGGIVSSGRKALVFSQFTQMLDILSKELKKNEIDHHYLSGKTKNRKELVNDFNENKNKQVFLISLKAGGTGLNLVSADNVIIFDPWWNPSVERQAIDRAHRIGQKNSVNVYRLITRGTIEEKIVKLQEKKKFLFDSLVGESQDLFQKLTWEEVKNLFL